MHLLVPTTSYPTQANPGSGIFVQRLLAHLPADLRITVLTPAARGPLRAETQANIRLAPVRYATRRRQTLAHAPGGLPAGLKADPWAALLLPAVCAAMLIGAFRHAYDADLIHAHWSLSGAIAGLAGRVAGKPAITTIWGSDFNLAREHGAVWLLLKACIRTNQRIVAVNPHMAAYLKAAFPQWAHKIITISNGAGDRFLAIRRRPRHDFSIAVIGNLTRAKGVHLAIRAFTRLAAKSDRARLMIVGDGPERGALQRLVIDLGIQGQVTFAGQVDPEGVPDILAASRALVLASSGEGRPNVVLEAMAAGVPVVASDIEGVCGLIEHDRTGLLFPVGEWEPLGSCLAHLFDSPEACARMSANARELIRSQGLTWSGCAVRYVQLYRTVLDEWRTS
jgi:glycosyltransferase involved in cell wall biosynthesis